MKMFPGFPALFLAMFPVFLWIIRVFSMFWISRRHPYGRSALNIELHLTTRNIENIRNKIETK